jgi:hypothetical protein
VNREVLLNWTATCTAPPVHFEEHSMPRTVELSVPSSKTDHVVSAIQATGQAITLSVERGASVLPPGDIVRVRATTDGARAIVGRLRSDDLYEALSIASTALDSLIDQRTEDALRGEAAESTWSEIAFFIRKESNPGLDYLLLMLLAGGVAAAGLWSNAPPIVIGAMLLAPALVPLLRVPFGLVGSDTQMAIQGVIATAAGYGAVLVGGFAAVLVLQAAAPLPWEMFRSYSWVQFWSTLTPTATFIAVVAAIAGAFALSNRGVIPLSGVLIALDLVPPTSMVGMALAAGDVGFAARNAERAAVDMAVVLIVGGAVLALERWTRHRYDSETPRE